MSLIRYVTISVTRTVNLRSIWWRAQISPTETICSSYRNILVTIWQPKFCLWFVYNFRLVVSGTRRVRRAKSADESALVISQIRTFRFEEWKILSEIWLLFLVLFRLLKITSATATATISTSWWRFQSQQQRRCEESTKTSRQHAETGSKVDLTQIIRR